MASTEANQGSPIPSLRLPDIVTSPPPHVSSSDAAVTAGPCDVTQPGASRAKPMRTKRRVMGDRTCLVCGDIAIAHNFGALTCETCKAFFRRNASKAQEIPPCQFSKNCVITRSTRRFCAACRMDKCFAVGMDQGLILDDKEKKALQARRREKQREQHEEGSMQMDVSKPAISVPQDSPSGSWHQVVSSHTPASTASGEKRRCDGVLASTFAAPGGLANDSKTPLASLQTFKDAAANSPSNGDPEQSGSTKDVTTAVSPSQMFEPFLAQGRQFRHVEREQLPWDMKLYWLLREEERSLLTKLTTAYTNIQITLHPPQPSDNFQLDQPLSLHSIMFILESTLRKCVHFAKTVPDFMELPEADQIAILKASALETYAIRSAALFVVERNAWHSYFGDMHMKDIMAVFGDPTSVEVFANYCAAMKSVVKANSTIYALVHCIILFDVRNARLEDFGKVSAIQDKYLVLLKHYLQSEFSYLHGSRYLAELMALLEDMHKLHHRILFFYKQFSSFFRPLISEFFAG